jgi:hypothetical protein
MDVPAAGRNEQGQGGDAVTAREELQARRDAITAIRRQLVFEDPVRSVLCAAEEILQHQWVVAYDAEKRANAAAARYEAAMMAAVSS